jgi:hypothetical protein
MSEYSSDRVPKGVAPATIIRIKKALKGIKKATAR